MLNLESPFSGQLFCRRWEESSWFWLVRNDVTDLSGGGAATENPSTGWQSVALGPQQGLAHSYQVAMQWTWHLHYTSGETRFLTPRSSGSERVERILTTDTFFVILTTCQMLIWRLYLYSFFNPTVDLIRQMLFGPHFTRRKLRHREVECSA